jgi:HPt (histidine-containing phosphotransfer) domain-containing protein
MGSEDLDEAVLGQLAADLGEAVAADLVLAFVEEMRGRQEPLRAAAGAGRHDVLGAEAHALRSSAGSYGAARVHALAARLEQACRQGDGPSAARLAAEAPAQIARAAELLSLWAAQRRKKA